MSFVVTIVATHLFTRTVRRELERNGHTQHPAITTIGTLAVGLL